MFLIKTTITRISYFEGEFILIVVIRICGTGSAYFLDENRCVSPFDALLGSVPDASESLTTGTTDSRIPDREEDYCLIYIILYELLNNVFYISIPNSNLSRG